MKGILDIYIERKTYRLSILVYHTNKIGFGEAIGKIADITDVSCLKKSVEDAMALSLSEYKSDKEKCNAFKFTKYKTWNKFFETHYVIQITYDDEKMLYRISMPEREKKTKSFGNSVKKKKKKKKKKEFDSIFDCIIKTMLDNLEKYQS